MRPYEERIHKIALWRFYDIRRFKKLPYSHYRATPYLKLFRFYKEMEQREFASICKVPLNDYEAFEACATRQDSKFVRKIARGMNFHGRDQFR